MTALREEGQGRGGGGNWGGSSVIKVRGHGAGLTPPESSGSKGVRSESDRRLLRADAQALAH